MTTITSTGRYTVGTHLFAVHFGYLKENMRGYGLFRQPMLYDNVVPDEINFIKLDVKEHHKVRDEWTSDDKEPQYDGYLLKGEDGNTYANQYPVASYGQTTDTGNRRFCIHTEQENELTKKLAENPKTVFDYHLLSDVLESIEKGIKELEQIGEDNPHYARCKEKLDLLKPFQERIIKEFEEKYPEYHVAMKWDRLWEMSTLTHPRVGFYPRFSLEKAMGMKQEDFLREYLSGQCIEVELKHDDRLVISKTTGEYLLDGKVRWTPTINVFYLENTGDVQDGKPCYHVCQTQYFRRTDVSAALEAFFKRLHNPKDDVAPGMTLEVIRRLDDEAEHKRLAEGAEELSRMARNRR